MILYKTCTDVGSTFTPDGYVRRGFTPCGYVAWETCASCGGALCQWHLRHHWGRVEQGQRVACESPTEEGSGHARL